MRYLKAFTLGSLAVGIILGAVVATVAAVATTGAVSDLRLAFGPVVLIAVRELVGGTETTFGPGLGLAALAGGLANAGALAWLGRRERRGGEASSPD
jgi:hypothetical protein